MTPDQFSSRFPRAAPTVVATYRALLDAISDLGAFHEQPKTTSIHFAAGAAFAGAHPQVSKLRLNIRTQAPLASPRLRRTEKVSANRYHNEFDLLSPADIDAELISWLRQARALSSGAA